MKSSIDKRIDTEITVSESLFACGLLDITDFLCSSLKVFLEKEGRYLGIVKSYMNTLDQTYNKFNQNLSEVDSDIYGRILFLLKPILIKEFIRLRKKKISEGDCIIVMIKKILSIISEIPEFQFRKEVKTGLKVITRMYDNIKNRFKKDALYNFSNIIRSKMALGQIGKYSLDKFDLTEIENKEKEIYSGPEAIVSHDSNKVTEISWTGE